MPWRSGPARNRSGLSRECGRTVGSVSGAVCPLRQVDWCSTLAADFGHFRRNVLDLPKGKLEPGETEVEGACRHGELARR